MTEPVTPSAASGVTRADGEGQHWLVRDRGWRCHCGRRLSGLHVIAAHMDRAR